MTDLRLPDVERLVSSYLRAHAMVEGLIGERVFTAYPAKAGEGPLVLVQRIGGTPPLSHPLVVDEAQLQIDAYGGGKALAWAVMATVLAAFDELEGQVRPEGSVAAVRQGAIRWQPDDTFKPARPRFIADVTLTTRPPQPAAERSFTPFAGVATTASA